MSKRISISEIGAHFNLKFIPRNPGTYVVGGTLRDLLLERCPKDYDIAAFHPPEAVAEQIARKAGGRPVRIGKGEKTIYRIVTASCTYDVSAGRGADIEDDLAGRDFTVNAMAFDLARHRLIDPQNGQNDLSKGLIRMIAPEAFTRDPLRLLRAFRMAAGLGFSIEPHTLAHIREKASFIERTAGERVRDEWLKLIAESKSRHFIEQMDDAGLLDVIFPELSAMKGCIQKGHHRFDVFSHSLEVYRQVERIIEQNRPALSSELENKALLLSPDASALIKHAALFHDIGKPATRSVGPRGRIHFYGHGKAGAEMAAAISDRLRMSNREKHYIDTLIRHHLHPLSLYLSHNRGELNRKTTTRFLMKTAPACPDLIVLSTADMLGKGFEQNTSDYIDFTRKLIDCYISDFLPASKKRPLITGHDLIERFGLLPSYRFAGILRRVEVERLAGRIHTRDEAFEIVKKILEFQNRS